MRKLLIATLLAFPLTASAQISVEIGLPSIHFSVPPPVVVVSPGIQVVVDQPEEIFLVNGYYWCRRDDYWYRSVDYRGNWVYVEHTHVPRTLYVLPKGKYKHYKHEGKVVQASGKKAKSKGGGDSGHGGGHGHGGHGGGHGHGGKGKGK